MTMEQFAELTQDWKSGETMFCVSYASERDSRSFTFYGIFIEITDADLVLIARHVEKFHIPIQQITDINVFSPLEAVDELNRMCESPRAGIRIFPGDEKQTGTARSQTDEII